MNYCADCELNEPLVNYPFDQYLAPLFEFNNFFARLYIYLVKFIKYVQIIILEHNNLKEIKS